MNKKNLPPAKKPAKSRKDSRCCTGAALRDLKLWIQAEMKLTPNDKFGLGQFEGMAQVCDEIDRRLRSPNTTLT